VKNLAVVLLSGGLDSTTLATLIQRQGYEVAALTVRYGQSHAREIDSARQVAERLGLEHRVIDVSFFRDLAWYSALTQPGQYALPTDRSPDEMGEEVPISYVPMRNTFFLTLAAAFLESRALHEIEVVGASPAQVTATIAIAANALDYSGYPDCRPEFYSSASDTLARGSKLGTAHAVSFRISTPLIDKSKADIVRLAFEVGAPLELSWSCYRDGPRPCGRCDSCQLRGKGFAEAGRADPALSA
jgi:7-cyano-7-deazaguanine synthase